MCNVNKLWKMLAELSLLSLVLASLMVISRQTTSSMNVRVVLLDFDLSSDEPRLSMEKVQVRNEADLELALAHIVSNENSTT